jgi:ribonuclease G
MKKIFINDSPWQTRIAITNESELQHIFFTSASDSSLERSFFKGTVTKLLPGIQTAFVDIGQEKAGFLHISEVDRALAIDRMTSGDSEEQDSDEHDHHDTEIIERKEIPLRHELDIGKIFTQGESILVQVAKEPINLKGAKLTTCFTLPGRFLVLMPNIPRIGISKKIEEKEERQRLREIFAKHLPAGMGAIIRTTCEYQAETEIAQDLHYLVDVWNDIQEKLKTAPVHEKIYEDIDLSLQIIRDHLHKDVQQVLVDSKSMYTMVTKFVKRMAPEYASRIILYEKVTPLFQEFGLEQQLEAALESKVMMKSGGSLVIETTEAMTVIDVNTGKYTGKSNFEETILKINLEAAYETVRQLCLRNIGGLVVIDFIDMASNANRQKLFNNFEKALKERDKFQSSLLRVSEFGLVQMTRKRSGKSLLQQLTHTCTCCNGRGRTKSLETQSFDALRILQNTLLSAKNLQKNILFPVPEKLFEYITTKQYQGLLELEKRFNISIVITVAESTK